MFILQDDDHCAFFPIGDLEILCFFSLSKWRNEMKDQVFAC